MSRRVPAILAAAIAAWSAGGCATTFEASTVDGAVKASNAFGFDFYRTVKEGKDNFVCSPAGAAVALTMVAAGARGKTQTEILHALHVEPTNLDQTYSSFAAIVTGLRSHDGKDGLKLNVADRVWVQKDLKWRPEYLSLLSDRFHASLAEVDFMTDSQSALVAINQWASDETHGRIPQILNTLRDETRMVLVNAVYMLGEWFQPFERGNTFDGKFVTVKEATTVKMMAQIEYFRYAQVRGARLVELPYKGGLSMVVVLPDDVDGLERIEDRLGGSYAEWIRAMENKRVDLQVPRFNATTDLPLLCALNALGIHRALSPDEADFSGMTENTKLFVGDAIQKAWIETSEKGTEAAAVTAIVMQEEVVSAIEALPPPPPVIFHADHPFMYLIRDTESGEILFMGRMVTPAS
jgi:serpin B